jgi:hypothetical protein
MYNGIKNFSFFTYRTVPQQYMTATGGTTTTYTSGGNTYKSHTFLASGNTTTASSFVVSDLGQAVYGATIEYLVIGGGGAGGDGGGGGGAGGLLVGSGTASIATYDTSVGAGGTAQFETGNAGNNGAASSIVGTGISLTAIGGGGGGGSISGQNAGRNGGSGGGGHVYNTTPGSGGTATQGYAGGSGGRVSNQNFGGGGGGAGSAGQGYLNYSYDFWGNIYYFWQNNAGDGIYNSYRDGTSVGYAGGGSPADQSARATTTFGGGGTNGAPNYSGIAGVDGKGGGGGAGIMYPGRGGSGIIIIRYRIA